GGRGAELLDVFRGVAAAAVVRGRAGDDGGWARVGWSPVGDRPYHVFQEIRVVDSWIHLQDVRDGLDVPGRAGEAGEEIVLNRLEAGLPYVVGKKMGARDGTTVRLNLTGPRGRSVSIAVARGRAEPVASIDGAPSLELTTSTDLYWRRGAGRVTADRFLAGSRVAGDEAMARSLAADLHVIT
ncbi:MAG: hypothetical protein ACHQFZ_11270, partial [Acidimicrobiales bacterium]